MDVKKVVAICFVCLSLAACDNGGGDPVDNQFSKAGQDGCDDQQVPGEYLVHWKNGEISVESSPSDKQFIETFLESHRDDILKAEPHYRIQIETQIFSNNDSRGWGGEINWGPSAVGADQLWGDKSIQSEIIVAVIDSGLDVDHPEIVEALAINEDEIPDNGLDDDGNGYVDDVSGYDFVADRGAVSDYTGHGTHVSGVIAAQHGEGKVLGVAPDVKILPLAFISQNGGGLVSSAVNAIRYAAAQGARVINASWGGRSCSTLLQNEIEALADQNILFVAAAGNSGNDLSVTPEYPAAFRLSNTISVAAATYDLNLAEFSNYGLLVDIAAPGANIHSTYPPEFDEDGILDGVVALDGTSMATPFVAAAAALLWSIRPEASYVDIKAALLESATPGPYHVNTRGFLNIPDALDVINQ